MCDEGYIRVDMFSNGLCDDNAVISTSSSSDVLHRVSFDTSTPAVTNAGVTICIAVVVCVLSKLATNNGSSTRQSRILFFANGLARSGDCDDPDAFNCLW